MERKKIEELADIYSGQIMSRVAGLAVKEKKDSGSGKTYKVITPKWIHDDGTITDPEKEAFTITYAPIDEKRIAKKGDIIIKLSSPFDAGIVVDDGVGAIIPSFCAVIRYRAKVNQEYLLAAINSSYVKKQLVNNVSGQELSTVIPIGKIKTVEIPVPDKKTQEQIGKEYIEFQNRLATIRRIESLEKERLDKIFTELE